MVCKYVQMHQNTFFITLTVKNIFFEKKKFWCFWWSGSMRKCIKTRFYYSRCKKISFLKKSFWWSANMCKCIKTHLYQIRMLKNIFFKGTVSRDFSLLVFFINQFPPSPRVSHQDRFEFFRKFAEIFAAQGLPPVSTTPVANGKNLQSEKF